MTSNINYLNINGSFPVAGQDNDTQTFRDNFTNIRNNFAYAKSEIESLQGSVAGNTLSSVDLGTQSTGTVTVNISTAAFQKITVSGPITISFLQWPSSSAGYSQLRLWLRCVDPTASITFPNTVSIGLAKISGVSGLTLTTLSSAGVSTPVDYVIDFSTPDGGNTVMASSVISP
jgi:hypothetical protein